ncbi:uncharacterized protein [Ambystoma mexicanum]|uniref:uncharacterized protein n=1 Tax=Ambystoma mexicanum TaxID=8296 RepID=UPI0037E9C2BF
MDWVKVEVEEGLPFTDCPHPVIKVKVEKEEDVSSKNCGIPEDWVKIVVGVEPPAQDCQNSVALVKPEHLEKDSDREHQDFKKLIKVEVEEDMFAGDSQISKGRMIGSLAAAARRRKPRFSEAELNMLADTLVENAGEVFLSDLRRQSLIRKKAIWEEVARKVSAVGTTPRTVRDCRKRWDDLRLRVRNLLFAQRAHGMATGGGPASPIKLQAWEETCSSILHLEAIEGVGDAEVGVPTSDEAGTSSGNEGEQPTTSRTTRARPRHWTTTTTSTQDSNAFTSRREWATTPAAKPTSQQEAPGAHPPPPAGGTWGTSTPPSRRHLGHIHPPEQEAPGAHPPPQLEEPAPLPQGGAPNNIGDNGVDNIFSNHSYVDARGFSPVGPMSPQPRQQQPLCNVRDIEGRLSRMEARQQSMHAMVQQYLDEARLMRETLQDTSRRTSRMLGRATEGIYHLAQRVREGNGSITTLVESIAVLVQAIADQRHMPLPLAPSSSTTPTSSLPSSPRRRSQRLIRPAEGRTPPSKRGHK